MLKFNEKYQILLGFNSYNNSDNTLSSHPLKLTLILSELTQNQNEQAYISVLEKKYYTYDHLQNII